MKPKPISLLGADNPERKDITRAPLAERMRPQHIDEILGQEHAIGPKSALGQILRTPGMAIPSVLLWGPPGVGKTTIAQVIAKSSNYRFVRLSGVLDGVKELREAVSVAEKSFREDGKRTLALVDEIHRFNKAQQDAFLPHMESGLLTVIGQTTENVSFRIRNTILSRLRVIELKAHDELALGDLLLRALGDRERGIGDWELTLAADGLSQLVHFAMGDARRALNALEWSAAAARAAGTKVINKEIVDEAFGSQPLLFDQDGDYHYDTVSAFIKSMRGSDPDAALYYMLRALEAGEDPLFITRRMIIFAAEDAACDPRALQIALDVDVAVQRVGIPEGKIPLAHGVLYLASCPKSNASYKAMKEMEKIIADNPNLEVPKRLRNAPTGFMQEMGNAVGYRYAHDYPASFVPERYLPEKLGNLQVYDPSDRGIEAQIKERLTRLRELIRAEEQKS